MSSYRDDREAARARIEELEAQIRDLTAAQQARDAELELHRRGAFLRSPAWTPLAVVLVLLFLFVGILDLRVRSSAEPCPPKVAVATASPPPLHLPSMEPLPSPPSASAVELCFKVYNDVVAARAGAGKSPGLAFDDSLLRDALRSCVEKATRIRDTESSGDRREGP